MCTKLEEPLILQQFLLFKETRSITQQLILQDLTERTNPSFNPFLDKAAAAGQQQQDLYNKMTGAKTETDKFTGPRPGSLPGSPSAPGFPKRDSLLQLATKEDKETSEEKRERREESPPVSPPAAPLLPPFPLVQPARQCDLPATHSACG